MSDANWSQCQSKHFFPARNDMLLDVMNKHCSSGLEDYSIAPNRVYEFAGPLRETTAPTARPD